MLDFVEVGNFLMVAIVDHRVTIPSHRLERKRVEAIHEIRENNPGDVSMKKDAVERFPLACEFCGVEVLGMKTA